MSFNQRKLWEAIQAPQSIEFTDEMEIVIEKYPYFQLLRTLVAKAKHDQQTPDAYEWLGKAAIYAPDRRRLRRVFYDELAAAPPSADTFQAPEAKGHRSLSEEEEEKDSSGHAIIIETPDTADTEAADESSHPEAEPTAWSLADDTAADDETTHFETQEPVRSEGEAQSEGRHIDEDQELRAELEKSLEVLRQSKEQLPDSTDPNALRQATTESSWASEEVSVEKPSPQQAIIERFMKANPSISRDMGPEKPTADLAASSTELQDGLVTENLAEIMLKQGKETKAIALYEKLMLKYPEKKTYFAQKIDQLKNN